MQEVRGDGVTPAATGPAAPELLDYAGVAELTGLKAGTLRRYRSIGLLPEPDALPVPDRPRWSEATIRYWLEHRLGRGAPGRPRARRATRGGDGDS